MLFILKSFHLNLTKLNIQIQGMQLKFNNDIQAITNAKVKELNIEKSINDVRVLWNYISSIILPVKKNFAQTSDTIFQYLKMSTFIYIIVSTVILVFVFLIVCCFLFSTSRYGIIYYFERVILFDLINAPPTRPIFVLHHWKKQRITNKLRKNYNTPHWTLYTYLVIFSWILIFLVIVSTISISLGELLYNEACVQLWKPTGLQNTDRIINSFLATRWNNIITYIQTILKLPINLSKPNKILESVRDNCTNDTGLFGVLRWTEAINISSFLWNTQNLNTLRSGLNLTYAMIIGINTKNLMPPDMTSFLNMASNITKYFDEIDYTVIIIIG